VVAVRRVLRRARAWTLALGTASASCGSSPLPRPYVAPLRYADDPSPLSHNEDAPFRATAPPLAEDAPLPSPSIQELSLGNGLRVLVVERHSFPMVAATLAIDTAPVEEGDVGGKRTYLLQRVYLAPPEGVLQTRGVCSVDGCSVSSRGPASRLDEVLGRIAELVRGDPPILLQEERLGSASQLLRIEGTDPIARNADSLLFGHAHRYGQPPATDSGLTLAQLRGLRARAFAPHASTLVDAGDVTPEAVREEAERRLGAWHDDGRPPEAFLPQPPPPASGRRIVAFYVSGIQQIRGGVAARGPTPADTDAPAFEVLADLLGAPLRSAIYHHVREELGAAYSVEGSIHWHRDASELLLRGSFDRDKAIDGMQAMLDEIRSARDAEVAPDVLERSKRARIAAWRQAMETDEGTALSLAREVLLGQSPESAQQWPARLRAVTAAAVRDAARRYLGVGALRVVLAGDPEYLVTAQSLRFGVPVRVDRFGGEL
jgi:zinc protease